MFYVHFLRIRYAFIKKNFTDRYDQERIKAMLKRVPTLVLGLGVVEIWLVCAVLMRLGTLTDVIPLLGFGHTRPFFMGNMAVCGLLCGFVWASTGIENVLTGTEFVRSTAQRVKVPELAVLYRSLLTLSNGMLAPLIVGLLSFLLRPSFMYLSFYTLLSVAYFFFVIKRRFGAYEDLVDYLAAPASIEKVPK